MIHSLAADDRSVEIDAADGAMLDYARKLTVTPAEIDGDDIARLRAHGFDDRGIHDICSIVAYFAFVNRIADGLGVEMESRLYGSDESHGDGAGPGS